MKQLPSCHLLIVAALTILTTDAQVSLETLGTSQTSFICGEQQILKCTIESYTNTMTWKKDNYSDILASCSPFTMTCSANPNVKTSYNFTFDTDNGIFQMEILKVKVSDNGTTYSCDNGVVPAKLISNVTVQDDYSIVKNDIIIDSNTTEISVTTGCIQDTADVHFEWLLREVNNNSSEKIKFNESASVTSRDDSVCLADQDCGVSGYSFITNSVNITDEGIGKNYSISVDITFDGIKSTVPFENLIFTLNFPVSESTAGCVCYLGIIIAFLTAFLIEMPTCVYFSTSLVCRNKLCFYCGTFWLCVALSFPFLGIVVKGALIFKALISGPDPLEIEKCPLVGVGLLLLCSLACEVIMILLCKYWCVYQWYTMILVIPDLICRWSLCIIIAVLYLNRDILPTCKSPISPAQDEPHQKKEVLQNSTHDAKRNDQTPRRLPSLHNNNSSTTKQTAATAGHRKLPPILKRLTTK